MNIHIDQTMACDLIEHVIEKRQSGVELGLAATVQIQLDTDLGFKGVAVYLRATHDLALCGLNNGFS